MTAEEVLNGRVSCTNSKTVACSSDNKKSSIPFLPEEIISRILIWLPADILYNSMRYVCRQWYNIINGPLFAEEHLRCSTVGLFSQHIVPPHIAQLTVLGKMNATVTEMSFPFPNRVLVTCDGLVLFTDKHNRTIYVANPLTKQRVTIPSFTSHSFVSYFSLARARSTKEYKVMCTYSPSGGKDFCVIVTVGKDLAWRPINCQNLSESGQRLIRYPSISTGGFLY